MKITSELAEICGIHAGDGHLRKTKYEFELSGGFEERDYYDWHVIPLFKKIFDFNIKGRFFLSKGTYGFRICNKAICNTIHQLGFAYGNKSLSVSVPNWILNSNDNKIKKSFLRGIFDTEGCITFDKKIRNTNNFKKNRNFYPRIIFTTTSKQLANGIQKLCKQEDFNCKVYTYQPKKKTENLIYKLQILGIKSLVEWIDKISPKNPMKLSRFYVWKKYGFCPTNITYKERIKILQGVLNPNSFYKDDMNFIK